MLRQPLGVPVGGTQKPRPGGGAQRGWREPWHLLLPLRPESYPPSPHTQNYRLLEALADCPGPGQGPPSPPSTHLPDPHQMPSSWVTLLIMYQVCSQGNCVFSVLLNEGRKGRRREGGAGPREGEREGDRSGQPLCGEEAESPGDWGALDVWLLSVAQATQQAAEGSSPDLRPPQPRAPGWPSPSD